MGSQGMCVGVGAWDKVRDVRREVWRGGDLCDLQEIGELDEKMPQQVVCCRTAIILGDLMWRSREEVNTCN